MGGANQESLLIVDDSTTIKDQQDDLDPVNDLIQVLNNAKDEDTKSSKLKDQLRIQRINRLSQIE